MGFALVSIVSAWRQFSTHTFYTPNIRQFKGHLLIPTHIFLHILRSIYRYVAHTCGVQTDEEMSKDSNMQMWKDINL